MTTTQHRPDPWPDEPWPVQRQRESAALDDRDAADADRYVALVGDRRTLLAEIDRLQNALAEAHDDAARAGRVQR